MIQFVYTVLSSQFNKRMLTLKLNTKSYVCDMLENLNIS